LSAPGAAAGTAAGSNGDGGIADGEAHNGNGNGNGAAHGPDLAALAQTLETVAGSQEELRAMLADHPAMQAPQDSGYHLRR
jgi:hypothetical protein